MRKLLLALFLIVVVAIASAQVCWAFAGTPVSVAPPHQIDFVSLEQSLDPLKSAFNKEPGKPRILVLVSPT